MGIQWVDPSFKFGLSISKYHAHAVLTKKINKKNQTRNSSVKVKEGEKSII